MSIPPQAEIAKKLRGEELHKWLELWRAEQGPAKSRSLELIAAAIPFPADTKLRVLDVCCGPGDAGRAIFSRFPNACVDFVDRDLFFTSLCSAVNQRDGVLGQTFVRDLLDSDWHRDFGHDYDVVVAANGLHWFSINQATQLFADIYTLLRPGGSFLFLEPVSAVFPFASGFTRWQQTQPSQHKREDRVKFWSAVNNLLGYDHACSTGPGELDEQERIGDKLSVLGWVGLLKAAGFDSIDVLLRDPEKVVLGALRPLPTGS
jgi:SAM-dependent methyltransferase